MIVLKVDMLVKPGAEEKCREYIKILQEHSRKEPGCLLYIGHQSTEDPRKFLFYEQYKDAAALEAPQPRPVQTRGLKIPLTKFVPVSLIFHPAVVCQSTPVRLS
jgi:quinol monooxygenase YgiN